MDHKRMTIALMTSAALFLGVGGCGRPDEPESHLQYGGLSSGLRSLLELAPGTKALVCGTDSYGLRTALVRSFQNWAGWAGRSRLELWAGESCSNRYTYNASLSIDYNPPSCSPGVVGWHTQNGHHHFLTLCATAVNSGLVTSASLHETGHAFGLCDQYPNGQAGTIAFNKNCVSPFHSRYAARSIMGGAYSGAPSQLTEDDIMGIRVMACRSDYAANKSWASSGGGPQASWRTAAFLAETRRLRAAGMSLLPACL